MVYRIARRPDPWQPPDWALAGPDSTFGNRFDDPEGNYRVIYASTQRLGCYLETLARFRVDLSLLAELAEIEGEDDHIPLGEVPPEWTKRRVIGSAIIAGCYADLYSSDWIGRLRRVLARECLAAGIQDLDAAALQATAPRSLTQRASRLAYHERYDGIHYRSKYGHDIENWSLFEPFQVAPGFTQEIVAGDPDLSRALSIHGLVIPGVAHP